MENSVIINLDLQEQANIFGGNEIAHTLGWAAGTYIRVCNLTYKVGFKVAGNYLTKLANKV